MNDNSKQQPPNNHPDQMALDEKELKERRAYDSMRPLSLPHYIRRKDRNKLQSDQKTNENNTGASTEADNTREENISRQVAKSTGITKSYSHRTDGEALQLAPSCYQEQRTKRPAAQKLNQSDNNEANRMVHGTAKIREDKAPRQVAKSNDITKSFSHRTDGEALQLAPSYYQERRTKRSGRGTDSGTEKPSSARSKRCISPPRNRNSTSVVTNANLTPAEDVVPMKMQDPNYGVNSSSHSRSSSVLNSANHSRSSSLYEQEGKRLELAPAYHEVNEVRTRNNGEAPPTNSSVEGKTVAEQTAFVMPEFSSVAQPSLERAVVGVSMLSSPGAFRVRGIGWDGNEDDDELTEYPNCDGNETEYQTNDLQFENGRTYGQDADSIENGRTRGQDDGSMQAQAECNQGEKGRVKKKTRCTILAILTIVIILALGVGLGVGLSSNGDDEPNVAIDTCEYADLAQYSMMWKKCLCNETLQDIPKSYKTSYLFVKDVIEDDEKNDALSCEASNIAIHWLAEETDKNIKENGVTANSPLIRYLLAMSFISWTGTEPDRWAHRSGWMTKASVCSWHGIKCNSDEDVTRIDLGANQLSGTIPSQLFLLSQLTSLNLNRNKIFGTIPTEIGQISLLENLDLHSNPLTGTIPSEVGYLTNIQHLFIFKNELTSFLPTNIGLCTELKTLALSENELDGKIPSEIGILSNLQLMTLHSNKLKGPIPSEIGMLYNLKELGFFANRLEGSIPTTIGNLQNVTRISIGLNQMAGSIPSEIGTLGFLKTLELSQNTIRGAIPTHLGLLHALESLLIFQNNLSGSFPSHIGNCTKMKVIDISGNRRMTGPIPSEIANLANLEQFNFEGNAGFTGAVPDELCSLFENKEQNLIGDCLRCDCCGNCK